MKLLSPHKLTRVMHGAPKIYKKLHPLNLNGKYVKEHAPSLDVGAGENPKGDINVDIRPLRWIDVVCHALNLPFKDCSFSKVFLSHVIEHFRYKDVARLLKEVNRVLKNGGKVEIWTPNFQGLGVLLVWIFGSIKKEDYPKLATLLTGAQDYQENVHLSMWTLKLLKIYLEKYGFKVVKIMGDSSFPVLSKIASSRCGNIGVIAVKIMGASSY